MRENLSRLVVRGGIVVTDGSRLRADLALEHGVVSELGEVIARPDDEVIDASGCFVLPGGVDFHTHIDAVFRGSIRTADDWASGSAAALAGGTTTVVDFCTPAPEESLDEAISRWRDGVAAQSPWVDHGAHMILVQPDEKRLNELAGLPEQGVSSVKLYLAYPGRMMSDDRAVFTTMQRAAELGLTVLIHAENGHAIEVLVSDALAEGHHAPEWHGRTRPPLTEVEAVGRATAFAQLTGARTYLVHLSTEAALRGVREARAAGAEVFAETCSHYLVLDESMLEGVPDEEAARLVCSPPTRSQRDQAALWEGLSNGTLSVLASDHCPFALHGQKIVDADFTHIMNGLPGVEQRMIIGYSGVHHGQFTLERLVEFACAEPARLAGLFPRKGTLRVGADADVVILDPEAKTTFSAATHHSAADYLPYEGMTFPGGIAAVVAGGRLAFEDGELFPAARRGRFLHRDTLATSATVPSLPLHS